jgi:hypothetical protein
MAYGLPSLVVRKGSTDLADATYRLKQLSAMTLTQQELPMKLGAARSQYPSGWRLALGLSRGR